MSLHAEDSVIMLTRNRNARADISYRLVSAPGLTRLFTEYAECGDDYLDPETRGDGKKPTAKQILKDVIADIATYSVEEEGIVRLEIVVRKDNQLASAIVTLALQGTQEHCKCDCQQED